MSRLNQPNRLMGQATAAGLSRLPPSVVPPNVAAAYHAQTLMRPHLPAEFYAGAGMFPIGFVPLQAPSPSMAAAALARTNAMAATQAANAFRFRERVPDMVSGF
jgi:hypothetical protein